MNWKFWYQLHTYLCRYEQTSLQSMCRCIEGEKVPLVWTIRYAFDHNPTNSCKWNSCLLVRKYWKFYYWYRCNTVFLTPSNLIRNRLGEDDISECIVRVFIIPCLNIMTNRWYIKCTINTCVLLTNNQLT